MSLVALLLSFRVVPTTSSLAGFATTGVLYPNTVSFDSPFQTGDAQAPAGAAVDETVTLTFNNDGNSVIIPAVQASLASTQGAGTLTFTATIPGTSGNNVQIAINAVDLNPIPVVVAGDLVTIYSSFNGTPLTLAQIAALPVRRNGERRSDHLRGIGTTSGNASTTPATNLAGGTDGTYAPVTHSYTVSSSAGAAGSSGIGYLTRPTSTPRLASASPSSARTITWHTVSRRSRHRTNTQSATSFATL